MDQQNEGVEEKPEEEEQKSTCCNRLVCVMYYIVLILFSLAFTFIVIIKIIGPILFTYVWIEMATNSQNYS
jgi:hypothetical protein